MIDYTNPNEKAVVEAVIRDARTRPARRLDLIKRLYRLGREEAAKSGNHEARLKPLVPGK
jgi:hypothetical protein